MTELTIKEAIAYVLNYRNKRVSIKQMQALCSPNRPPNKRINAIQRGRMWFIPKNELDTFDFSDPGRPRKDI